MELIQGADRSKWIAQSNHNVKCFTRGEIETITDNYKTIIGRGAFGEVYIGFLDEETKVAVKRFIHNVIENFAKELTVHREINHKNVVRLIGYCVEDNALLMVTEYIPNGNLSDILHHGNIPITLDIRLKIAVECAEALAYMHSHMYTKVIHGDIKPANILLDVSFSAKISDFGISRLVNTDSRKLYTETIIGSKGYMDPLFARDGLLTVKSDVYSFGVVLLELLSRKKATREDGEVSVVDLFIESLARGPRRVREIFDGEIAGQNNMKILEGIAKLAHECLILERDKRPEMIDVAERLRLLRKAAHQDQSQVGLFAWLWKGKPAPPSEVAPPGEATILSKTSPSEFCRRFTLKEIKAATNNFDRSLLLGNGFSTVYCGEIVGVAIKVAIKCYKKRVLQSASGFCTEIETMSKLRHHHLVPLIGYCDWEDEIFLVYNYMPRGTLGENLYGDQKPPLTWEQRLEICIGAARGLKYIHELRIIHGNVDLQHIQLDEEWVAKIVPIGLSMTDPSTHKDTRVTEKSDVYSFGVVLFEVLYAKPYLDFIPTEEHDKYVNWVVLLNEGNLELVVRDLEGIIPPYVRKFAQIAEKCLGDSDGCPSMGDVLLELEDALHLLVMCQNYWKRLIKTGARVSSVDSDDLT